MKACVNSIGAGAGAALGNGVGSLAVWLLLAGPFTVQYRVHFTESCPSGRRSTIGNRVGVKSVSGVQIPDSPPAKPAVLPCSERSTAFHPMRRGGRVDDCGGLENRLPGVPGYEGSNPSSSARIDLRPGRGVFYCGRRGRGSNPSGRGASGGRAGGTPAAERARAAAAPTAMFLRRLQHLLIDCNVLART